MNSISKPVLPSTHLGTINPAPDVRESAEHLSFQCWHQLFEALNRQLDASRVMSESTDTKQLSHRRDLMDVQSAAHHARFLVAQSPQQGRLTHEPIDPNAQPSSVGTRDVTGKRVERFLCGTGNERNFKDWVTSPPHLSVSTEAGAFGDFEYTSTPVRVNPVLDPRFHESEQISSVGSMPGEMVSPAAATSPAERPLSGAQPAVHVSVPKTSYQETPSSKPAAREEYLAFDSPHPTPEALFVLKDSTGYSVYLRQSTENPDGALKAVLSASALSSIDQLPIEKVYINGRLVHTLRYNRMRPVSDGQYPVPAISFSC